MHSRAFLVLTALLVLARPCAAQYYQTDFPPEEFRERWEKVFEKIGNNAIAVLQGMPMTDGFIFPRQYNNFYYLSGIETPGAYLLLDGRTKMVTLYLPPRNAALEQAEGRILSASDVDLVKRLAGVHDVQPLEAMARPNWPAIPVSSGPRAVAAVYAEFSPPEGAEQSRGELVIAETARATDYWDGAVSRQRRFVALLRVRNPRTEIRDLDPILDELRSIKSPREIALVWRASQIAGFGLMEAMRSTEPGVTEYRLDAAARYVFLVNGARLEAYRSITAAGTENINTTCTTTATRAIWLPVTWYLWITRRTTVTTSATLAGCGPSTARMLHGSANWCSLCWITGMPS